MSAADRPGSAGFSRHLMQMQANAAKQPQTGGMASTGAGAGAAAPASSSSSPAARSSYTPLVRPSLLDRMGGGVAPARGGASERFERQPAPNFSSQAASSSTFQATAAGAGTSAGASPFIFHSALPHGSSAALSSRHHPTGSATAAAASAAAVSVASLSASPPAPSASAHRHAPSPLDWHSAAQPSHSAASANSSGGGAPALRSSVKLPRDQLPLRPPPNAHSHGHGHGSSPFTAAVAAASTSKGSAAPSASPVATVRAEEDLHAAEQRMLDDIGLFRQRAPAVTVESLLRDRRKAAAAAAAAGGGGPDSTASLSAADGPHKAPSDFSLVTSLTSRLASLEKIAGKQAKAIGAKDAQIAELQSELRARSMAAAAAAPSSSDAGGASDPGALFYALQRSNEQFQRQVREMETFLGDYGLVWVGFRAEQAGPPGTEGAAPAQADGAGGGSAHSPNAELSPAAAAGAAPSPSPSPSAASAAPSADLNFSVSAFIAAIGELNHAAGEGGAMRIHTNAAGVTKFLPPVALPLLLYRDGMWFRGGPLRRWDTAEARAFVADVMDGYFPGELREEFPEGVAIEVVDRSAVRCMEGATGAAAAAAAVAAPPNFQAFAGRGNRLEDGKVVESSPSPSPSPSAATASARSPSPSPSPSPSSVSPKKTAHAPPPVPLETFLNRLPASVVHNGKLLEVRGGISRMLSPSPSPSPSPSAIHSLSTSPPVPSGSPLAAGSSPSPPKAAAGEGAAGANRPSNVIMVDTPTLRALQAREAAVAVGAAAGAGAGRAADDAAASSPSSSSLDLSRIATLQVKMDPSDQSAPLLLKLPFDARVGEVRRWVESFRGAHNAAAATQFDLRTTYPARSYPPEEDDRTLLDAGLTPNANLFVRNKRPLSAYRPPPQVEQPKPDESWSTAPADAEN